MSKEVTIQDLKTRRWSKEMSDDFSHYKVKDESGKLVCRIYAEDFKECDAGEFELTANLIEICPQLFEQYTELTSK